MTSIAQYKEEQARYDEQSYERELRRVEAENEAWFEHLAAMQLDEQLVILNACLDEVKASRDWAMHYRQTFRLNALKRRLESEIKRVRAVLLRACWQDAVRKLYGQEGLDLVKIEIEHQRGLPYADLYRG
jgi:hypothetical protein